MMPAALEVSLAVFEELRNRNQEADRLRRQQVERARYESNLARDRYMRVDPNNRLVADALEADWNDSLRTLTEAERDYEERQKASVKSLDKDAQDRIFRLTRDFPKLWNNPQTSDRQRKRMVRLLIEDVTLTKSEQIVVQIRFRGGATRQLPLPIPRNAWQLRQTNKAVIQEVDRLLDTYTDGQVAEELNRSGLHSGGGLVFTTRKVAWLRGEYHLKSRYQRLREAGKLTQQELARKLGILPAAIRAKRQRGLLAGYPYNDKNECLYDPPAENDRWETESKHNHSVLESAVSDRPNQVQHAT